MNKFFVLTIIVLASIFSLLTSFYLFTYHMTEFRFQVDDSQRAFIYYFETSDFDFYINEKNDLTIETKSYDKDLVITNNTFVDALIAGWKKIKINENMYLIKPKDTTKCEQLEIQLKYPFTADNISSLIEGISCSDINPEFSYI